jgi:hypothetical protein
LAYLRVLVEDAPAGPPPTRGSALAGVRAPAWGYRAVGGRNQEGLGAVEPLPDGGRRYRTARGPGHRSKGAGPLEPWKSRGQRIGARFKWVAKLEAQQTI